MSPTGKRLRIPSLRECDRESNESSFSVLTPISSLDENLDAVKDVVVPILTGSEDVAAPVLLDSGDAAAPVLTGSRGIDGDSFGKGGPPFPPPPDDTNYPLEPPLISDSDGQVSQHPIGYTVRPDYEVVPRTPRRKLPDISIVDPSEYGFYTFPRGWLHHPKTWRRRGH